MDPLSKAKPNLDYSSNKANLREELGFMMYGFGDSIKPDPESVSLMEQILLDYLQKECEETYKLALSMHLSNNNISKASSTSKPNVKVTAEHFKFRLRKDKKKLYRIQELMYMNEDIRKAKQLFSEDALQ